MLNVFNNYIFLKVQTTSTEEVPQSSNSVQINEIPKGGKEPQSITTIKGCGSGGDKTMKIEALD